MDGHSPRSVRTREGPSLSVPVNTHGKHLLQSLLREGGLSLVSYFPHFFFGEESVSVETLFGTMTDGPRSGHDPWPFHVTQSIQERELLKPYLSVTVLRVKRITESKKSTGEGKMSHRKRNGERKGERGFGGGWVGSSPTPLGTPLPSQTCLTPCQP